MLVIRPTGISDVNVLNDLIHEMADYEHLPAAITSENLARAMDLGRDRNSWRCWQNGMENRLAMLFSSIVIPRSGAAAFSSKTSL